MAKKDQSAGGGPQGLTYHFAPDGALTGVSYSGALDAASYASVKQAALDAKLIAKGRIPAAPES